MKKNYFKKIISTLVASMIILSSAPSMSISAAVNTGSSLDFGTGNGVKWPSQVNAPYVDLVSYYSKEGWSINGPVKLSKLYQDTGVKFYNLGFIQSAGGVNNGKIKWGWGGYSVLSESGSNHEQYLGIKQSIKELRDAGGDVAISFGGAAGTAFWQTTQDVDVLANTYIDIIDGYNLTRIDLDVEGGAQNKTQNIANAKAIKKVQDATGVDVVLTLPVLPNGLTYEGLGVLEAYLANGVNLKVINIMTMCYGTSTLLPGEDYGAASVRAVESLKDQLKNYYSKYTNLTLTDEEAFAKIGTTVSIGYESGEHPIFTLDMSRRVVNHAISKKLGMTSFWAMNRDCKLDANQGVNTAYEFTNIFKNFGTTIVDPTKNTAPEILGVSDKTINVGSQFDKLSGITAKDKEDGDLTKNIIVSGDVNTKVAGRYELIYSVKDSKGLETVVKAIITVTSEPIIEAKEYVATEIYVKGDLVIYNGVIYRAKWWTQGVAPGTDDVWEKVGDAPGIPTNIIDLAKVAAKYNKVRGEEGYDTEYDLNNDGIVDIYDMVITSKKIV